MIRMKRILVLVFSNLKHDARVMRQINFLKDNFLLTVVCFDAEDSEEFRIIRLPATRLTFVQKSFAGMLLLAGFYSWAYRVLYPVHYTVKRVQSESFDLVIANDAETLPLAFRIAGKKASVIFDAHEYAPRHFENVFTWKLFFQKFNIHICKKYLPLVGGMSTVGSRIAAEYRTNFGVSPVVVTNAPPYQALQPQKTNTPVKLIHHGIVNRSRGLELMIDMMKLLPENFTLDLVLLIPPSASSHTHAYLEELKAMSAFTNRIRFCPPVKANEIVPLVNQYDVGVILIPPINFNYENTLPNKFFEYIQARVALAIGPTPEMAAIVNEYQLGVVATDFSPAAMANAIRRLTQDKIDQFKTNTHAAASVFCAEKNREIVLNLVNSL